MLEYQEQFVPLNNSIHELKVQVHCVRRLRREAKAMGYQLIEQEQVGWVSFGRCTLRNPASTISRSTPVANRFVSALPAEKRSLPRRIGDERLTRDHSTAATPFESVRCWHAVAAPCARSSNQSTFPERSEGNHLCFAREGEASFPAITAYRQRFTQVIHFVPRRGNVRRSAVYISFQLSITKSPVFLRSSS